MRRARFALIVSAAALTCLWLADSRVSEAAEAETIEVAAAALDGDTGRGSKHGQAEPSDGELQWVLAQLTPADGTSQGEMVLAIFAASTPAHVEEEVAKAHKLEFVKRLSAGTAEKRIVLFRITDGRSAADVVAALERDARVSKAQPNVRYALVPQSPPSPTPSPPPKLSPRAGTPSEPARHAKRQTAKVERRRETPAPAAKDGPEIALKSPPASRRSEQRSGLVASSQTALRFPTADEPFVNIGTRNR